MVEAWGFRNTSLFYWIVVLLTGIMDFVELGYNVKHKLTPRKAEYKELK
jgi:hypothetical protein